uniref:SdrD B-like domain-containing protein n=1 Tax=Candidatus Oscillochloris fontis TaxID=2496868 RepID=UPI00101D0243
MSPRMRHSLPISLFLIAIIVLTLLPVGLALAAPTSTLDVRISTSTPVVGSGDWAVIKVDYSCSSIYNTTCDDVVVSVPIPPELSQLVQDVQVLDLSGDTDATYSPTTATWTFTDDIAPGSAGTFTLMVRFPRGATPDGATATLRASATSTSAPPVTSKPLTLTATAEPRTRADKRFVSGGVLDINTVYRVEVCVPGTVGVVDVTDLDIRDTLPAGAEFVSATGGGVYSAGTITWADRDIMVSAGESCVGYDVTVRFPDATFNVGNEIRNDMEADVTYNNGATAFLSDFDLRLIQPPTPNPGFSKNGPTSASIGDIVTYTFTSTNAGTSPLDAGHTITDPIPAELEVTRITAGTHNQAPTVIRLQIEYQIDGTTTWNPVPGSPFTSGACFNIVPNTGGSCADITLGVGERITALRYTYLDALPYGFAATNNGFTAEVISSPINQIIVNTADARYSYNGYEILRPSERRTRVVDNSDPGARPTLGKAVDPSTVQSGDVITYTLTLVNNNNNSTPLINPQISDLLINELLYVAGSQDMIHAPVGTPDPTFELIPNYNGTGKTLLNWQWDSYSLPPGETIEIEFQAQIAPYTPAQSLSNTAYLAGWGNQPGDIWIDSCTDSSPDTYDFDNDGNTQEQICSSTISSVSLAAAAKSGSHKLVMGQLDTKWTYDPEFGYTVPGGSATYQLTITNTGTIPIGEITLLDILPWVGDVGVRSFQQDRGTEWRPFLAEPITVPSGASVFYSTQTNPCRAPDLSVDPTDDSPGCTAPVWSSTPPADITTVQSFKVEFGDLILMPEESVTLTVSMQAPYSDPAFPPDHNLIAWNSFGYRARAINSTEYLLSSDPPRVGIKREASQPPGYGNYVWLDNDKDGIQDAGEPGINGARVDLFLDDDGVPGPSAGDTFIGTKVTGPDDAGNPGYYLFSESFPSTDPRYPGYLEPGDYYAQFTPPLGYGRTIADQGGDGTDSDANQTTGLTAVTTLAAGEIDLTWDAGVTASTAVGNYVWIDRNANGLQDEAPGDGVNGVTVRLYTSGGVLVGTTTTHNDPFGQPGYYVFDNLTPGNYYVEFVAPSGFTFTDQNSGNDAADSDANPANGRTATFTLLANQYDPNWDAGLIVTAGTLQLGNLVWRDLDNNGRYDPSAGESGINGVTVSLYRDSNNDGVPDPGEHVGDTTTSTHLGQPGWYQFSNLEAGSYIAVLEASNFAFDGALRDLRTSTGNDPAPDPDTDIDQDDNGFTQGARIISQPITLSANGEPNTIVDGDDRNANQTLDFGLIGGAALGNRVWFDTDSDGVQDVGELGVAGITVELLNDVGTVLKTTTTNADGIYGFADLAPGDYRVRFSDLPSGHTFTSLNSGSDTGLDSDANPGTGTTVLTTLVLNETDLSWDAGLVAALSSLGNRAWDDLDRDGIQDAGEPGINGVTASLYRADGTFVTSTVTANVAGEDGIYGFSNLPPGDYYVVFSNPPAGYAISPINTGTDDTIDSDADRVTGQTAITTLLPGENDPTWDLGIFTYASIGDRVWNDYDRNGVQDGGESGVPNVTVRLYQPGSSIPLASTTTNSSGNYSFSGLIPDREYYVEFVMPSGYKPTGQNVGADDGIDSDASLLTFQTIPTELSTGENDITWDFGIYQTASISNLAWLDLDADGVQDANETNGVPGVQVILYNQVGSAIDSTVTNTSGIYNFSGLEPGIYSLRFLLPDTYILSPQDAGGNDATDSDAAPVTFTTIQTELIPGENDMTWDIGLFQPSALGDRVWHDVNGNGVQDPGEDGIENVVVTLYTPGPDGVIGGGDDVAVGSPDTTDADGNYRFDNLAPGTYYVVFGATPGYTNVSPANSPSGDSDNNSDADQTTRTTPLITLPSSTSDMSWDMGVYNTVGLGNYVWVDTNADGIQNEPASNGVNGVTVSLYTINGMFVGTDTTENDGLGNPGYYLFPDLAPGNYYVVFSDIPADHVFTQRDQGGDNALDSDVLQVITGLGEITGVSSMISLSSGQPDDLTWDAGIFPVISVGDVVWLDANANGIQDPDERVYTDVNGNGNIDVGETPGVAGVRVELYNDSGDLVDVTYTNLDGNYLFEGLFPDTYHIVFSNIPAGYQRSPENRGADDAVDSDADSSYTIPDFPTPATDLTRDMGLYELASIGDYVWHDVNANGVQEAGEPPIANVSVRLVGTDGTGAAVDLNTTTDSNGYYRFQNLVPGNYHVEFTMPAGYDRASAPDRGTDNTLDSDIDTTTLRTPDTELRSGENDLTWDAGFYSVLRLGNLVWHDLNNNGLADDGATGIPNVDVVLTGTDGLGNLVNLTDTTDSNGLYLFENLMPGEYVVTIPASNFSGAGALAATSNQPAYVSSSGTNGSLSGPYEPAADPDNNTDNNDNGTLSGSAVVAQPITLRSQDEPLVAVDTDDNNGNLTVDFGFFRPLSLGNLVWNDLNNNGLVDGGESGIDNVTVQLYRDDGDNTYDAGDTLITTDTTSGGGLYNFENLAGGNYFVIIPASNFSGTNALAASGGMAAYRSSTGINGSATGPYEAPSANDLDNNDDGTTIGSDVVSFMVTLSDGGEPPSGVDTDGLNGNQTVDFGFFRPARLGNLVWLDRDADGIQDGGDETGINGVTVTLLDSAGSPVDGDPVALGTQAITTVTAGGGTYQFTNLAPGDYRVGFTPPADYYHSRTGAGTAATDSDADPATGWTATTTLTPGESDQTWDTGLYQKVRLGNLVWDDLNNNGLADDGATGIEDVEVVLTGTDGAGNTVNLTDTTDSNGLYLFDNLVPGIYTVTIPAINFTGAGALAPSGDRPAYRSSTGTNGSATGTYQVAPDPDNNTNNDDNGSTSGSDVAALPVTLRSQDEPLVAVDTDDNNGNLTVDFGFFRPLSLGNLVWNDLDNDKTFDSGTENGINGVRVELYLDTDSNNVYTAGTDTLVTWTTTDVNGNYLFDNLIPGNYVVVIPATNFGAGGALRYFRSSDSGAATDSATDPDTGDTNNDDNGVGPSSGVATALVSSGAVTLSLNGEPINDGDTNSNSNLALDFGFYSLSVGNLVWRDDDNDGIKDATETGFDGLTVVLYYDADNDGIIDTSAETILTSNDGHYFFGGLRSGGNYEIRVTTPGADWVSSTGGANGVATGPYEPGLDPDAPDNDVVDNNDNGTQQAGANTVSSPIFQVNVGTAPTTESDLVMPTGVTDPAANNSSNLSIDFGLFNHARMGDLVWIDTNGNGVQDASETTGVAGITVTLYDSGGTEIAHTDTDSNGLYSFSYLNPGDYYVIFDLGDISPDFAVSPANAGGTAATNSDASQTTGQTSTFTLTYGDNDTDWDMGIYPRVSLGNLIWDDLDNDGLADVGEPGIPNVQVDLYNDTNSNGTYDAGTDTFVVSQDTNGTGNYLFTRLEQGDYLVVIPASEFASGGPLYRYRSSTGQNGLGINVYEPAPDPDDGVGAPTANNTNNDDNGTDHGDGYTFTRAISLNPSYEPTNDGDTDPNTNLTLDLGFFQNLNLGNLVWEDTDNNGIYDSGEPLLDNVLVELYMDDGDGSYDAGDSLINTTTTGINGIYNFDDLIPGNYIVVLPASNFNAGGRLEATGGLAAYRSSTGVNGVATGPYEGAGIADPDNDLDNRDDGTTIGSVVASLPITLARNLEPPVVDDGDGTNGNQTVDFGLFRPASLGDRVWNDLNANGIQDAGEVGITGVIVSLLDGSGNPVLDAASNPITATTDGTGAYRFDNLIPGTYSVSFTKPATYISTLVDQGADAAADSDADRSTGVATGTTTLVEGQHDPNWDAGFYRPISIGNQVWYDTNNNNARGGTEVGINGVQVELFYDANNDGSISGAETTPVAVTTTAADGTYLFTTRNNTNSELLNPGTYRVGIPASQFEPVAGVLRGYYSSRVTMTNAGVLTETGPPDPDTNASDTDDNGARQTSGFYNGGVLSLPVTIVAGSEPINENPDVDPNTAERPDNSDNQTVDFGFYTASVGNIVWDDNGSGTLADGLRNGAESGIANVRVRLFAQNGSTEIPVGPDGLLGTSDDATGGMLTDPAGNYSFGRLPGGNYRVQIELPTGYVSTRDTAQSATPSGNTDNDDNGIGSDQTATTVMSNEFTLVPGGEPSVDNNTGSSDDPTIDFGIVRDYSLGNRVWEDLDNDGLLNNGEIGLDGVVVRLYMADGTTRASHITGVQVADQTTINGGYYRFDNLPAGDYIVEVLAANFINNNPLRGYFSSTGAGQEADPDGGSDSNDNGLDTSVAGATRSAVVTLGEGSGILEPTGDNDPVTNPLDSSEAPDAQSNRTVDFGFVPIYSLGNRVWHDTNNNGLMDGTETGIEDVTVRLYEADGTTQARDILGNLVANQDTDANGYYRFDNLLAGDYIVEIVDTNFTGTGALVTYVSSSGAETDPNSDGDRNDNGLDIPVLGAIQSGVVTLGGNAEPSTDNDPATNPEVGESRNDRSNRTLDFGFYQPVSIGNRVWYDTDNSRTFDVGEQGINGVRVELFFDADGNGSIGAGETSPVAVAFTAADGTYLFTQLTDSDGNPLATAQLLRPGTYVVGIPASELTGALRGLFSSGTTIDLSGARSETAPADPDGTPDVDGDDNGQLQISGFYNGGVLSLPLTVEALNQLTGENPDSDPNPSYRPDSSDNQTVDFGFYGMSLGNLVWLDDGNGGGTANDGIRNGNEAGITGVTVRLLASDGTVLQTTATDANGRYLFTGLAEGTYSVSVAIPNGLQSSRDPAQAGTPNALDNDDNGVIVNPTTMQSVPVILDAGAAPTGEIDQGVTTGAGMGNPVQTDNPNTLDENSNLHVDFGFVPLDWGDLPAPYATLNANNGPRHGLTTGLQIGATVDTETDGQPSAAADGDGADEDGVSFPTFYTGLPANVTVNVTNTTGRDATLYGFMDFNGDGDFADAGETVTLAIPDSTTGNQTLTFNVPNDAVVGSQLGARFRLSSDPSLTATGPASDGEVEDYLITITPTYSLGNRVWHDTNNNGLMDSGEAGIEDVTVRLLDSAGNPVTNLTGMGTATTD